MAEEDKVSKDEPIKEEVIDYNDLSQQTGVREVEMPPTPGSEGDENGKKPTGLTVSEALEQASDLTDMQAAMAKLFPGTLKTDDAMIGRIAPEIFLPLLHLASVNEIMTKESHEKIDVTETYVKNYIMLSIGLDGMGRIDVAAIAGAAKEEKKSRDLLSGLGKI